MNILHNRFAGLWRQDLSQNVTTKENWKRSCYSSLVFDRLLISSHVHPFTQWVEYVLPRILCEVAPVPSHNVQALHFLHFIECSWKVNGYFVGLSVLPEIKSHYKTTMTQGNPATFSHKGLWPKWMSVSYAQKYFIGDTKIDHHCHFLPSSFSEILIAAYLKRKYKYMVTLTELDDQ